MKKLRAEILEHVGTVRHPTYDDIRSMKYLRAVLNGMYTLFTFHRWLNAIAETLRLFPPV